MKLKGKTFVVTGATSSIGKQLCIELNKQNVKLFISGRSEIKLKSLQQEMNCNGDLVKYYSADLTDPAEATDLANRIKNETSSIDAIINVAGAWHNDKRHFFGIPVAEFPDEVIENDLDLLKGITLLVKNLLPKLSSDATIIALSGSFDKAEKGVLGEYLHKKGIENLIQQLHYDMSENGIRTYAIAPWYVWTEYVKKFWPDMENDCLMISDVTTRIIELIEERPATLSGTVISLLPEQ